MASSSKPVAFQDGESSVQQDLSSKASIKIHLDYTRGTPKYYTNLNPNTPRVDTGRLLHREKDANMAQPMESKKEEEEREPLPPSFIRTYTAMRGPVFGKEGYPLAELMQRERPYHRGQALDLEGITSEELASIPKHPGWDDDPDDVEGSAPSAQITPEAFLAFAQGAQRAKRDEIKDPKKVLAKQTRLRPEESSVLPLRPDKPPRYLFKVKSQADEETGETYTPIYEVPRSPSIIYTPPGVPDMPYKTATFLNLYSRMNPTPRAIMDVPPTGANDHYTKSDVKRIAQANADAGIGRSGSEVVAAHDAYLEEQLRIVAQVEDQEKDHAAVIDAQKKQIEKLETEYRILKTTYIPILNIRRKLRRKARKEAKARAKAEADQAVQKAMEDAKNKANRDERVREHMVGLVMDIRHKYDTAVLRYQEATQKRFEQEEMIKRLEQDIAEECLIVGKCNFDEVYEAVNRAPPLPELPSSDDSLKKAGLVLRPPVSVFEPGQKTSSVPKDRVSDDNIYDASPVRHNTSPFERTKSPKGKWVVREGCEFDLTFGYSDMHSMSMSHLGSEDGLDLEDWSFDAECKAEREKKMKQMDSSRFAWEEKGESSKQGAQGEDGGESS
ncbi:hypothetical protein F4805DRAFT_246010 [Annulohypoxylon moriforme]|nr:hypothetical protein F4805DRAFT_246010 [Annulohypoxylon moriforme]